MFDLTKEVPSLELCKRLKGLGYPQKGGGWYWIKEVIDGEWQLEYFDEIDHCPHILMPNDPDEYKGKCEFNGECKQWWSGNFWHCEHLHLIKAPTVSELGEWLPVYSMAANRTSNGWVIYDNTFEERFNDFQVEADTESNARAKMLIWLAENGEVEFNKEER